MTILDDFYVKMVRKFKRFTKNDTNNHIECEKIQEVDQPYLLLEPYGFQFLQLRTDHLYN